MREVEAGARRCRIEGEARTDHLDPRLGGGQHEGAMGRLPGDLGLQFATLEAQAHAVGARLDGEARAGGQHQAAAVGAAQGDRARRLHGVAGGEGDIGPRGQGGAGAQDKRTWCRRDHPPGGGGALPLRHPPGAEEGDHDQSGGGEGGQARRPPARMRARRQRALDPLREGGGLALGIDAFADRARHAFAVGEVQRLTEQAGELQAAADLGRLRSTGADGLGQGFGPDAAERAIEIGLDQQVGALGRRARSRLACIAQRSCDGPQRPATQRISVALRRMSIIDTPLGLLPRAVAMSCTATAST